MCIKIQVKGTDNVSDKCKALTNFIEVEVAKNNVCWVTVALEENSFVYTNGCIGQVETFTVLPSENEREAMKEKE